MTEWRDVPGGVVAKNKRISGIDVDEDLEYQQREWRFQPFGWAVMWLLILAALLGLFGKGPLANASLGDPTGVLTVNYARFERYRSPTTIEVIVGANQARQGKIALWLDRQFVNRIDIERIDPEPESVKSDVNRMLYDFALTDPTQPAHVFFKYQYGKFGPSEARLGLENGPELTLHQMVYP